MDSEYGLTSYEGFVERASTPPIAPSAYDAKGTGST
jgi:hypothetical protein